MMVAHGMAPSSAFANGASAGGYQILLRARFERLLSLCERTHLHDVGLRLHRHFL